MRTAFLNSLTELAGSDPDVMFLTADLGYGVFEDYESSYPKQYLNVGVAEQAMTGLATGLALEGKKVFTYSIGNFPTLRCLEQIRNDAAYHDANVNIVASGGGFSYGQLGMSHHATEDLAILRALPGVEVYCPCTAKEAGLLTRIATERKGVSYLRLDKTVAIENLSTMPFIFGKLRKFASGQDIAIITTGGILSEVLKAKEALDLNGINVCVYGCHSLKPFDRDKVIELAAQKSAIVTVEEHNIIGGLGSVVAESLLDANVAPKRYLKIGLDDVYSSVVGDQSFLRGVYHMDASNIASRIQKLIGDL